MLTVDPSISHAHALQNAQHFHHKQSVASNYSAHDPRSPFHALRFQAASACSGEDLDEPGFAALDRMVKSAVASVCESVDIGAVREEVLDEAAHEWRCLSGVSRSNQIVKCLEASMVTGRTVEVVLLEELEDEARPLA